MQPRKERGLAIAALIIAVWRRHPSTPVIVHSDQSSQYSSHDWQLLLKEHNMIARMRRRGTYCDNAVTESFFQLLKRERIRRKIYATRDEARCHIFECIELFYNPKRRHGYTDGLSPVDYKKQYFNRLESVY